jgi:hypothetical protein
MCKWGTSVILEVTIPAHLSHTGEQRQKAIDVDACIAPIVKALNAAGIVTIASCCGHGKRPGNIALADGRELVIAPDYTTGRAVDQAFPPIKAVDLAGGASAPSPDAGYRAGYLAALGAVHDRYEFGPEKTVEAFDLWLHERILEARHGHGAAGGGAPAVAHAPTSVVEASAPSSGLVEKWADTFAMEFMTGHYRPLRDDEKQRYDQLRVVMLAFAAQIQRASPPSQEQEPPHTGDDELLDHLSSALTELERAIDEDDDQYGSDARETVSQVMDKLEKASALRVAELHSAPEGAGPRSGPQIP